MSSRNSTSICSTWLINSIQSSCKLELVSCREEDMKEGGNVDGKGGKQKGKQIEEEGARVGEEEWCGRERRRASTAGGD